jgi:hypothetical protein
MTHSTGPFAYNKDDQQKPQVLAGYPLGDIGPRAEYVNDFVANQDYAAADWTITTVEAGAGAATEAISASEIGGALVITNDDADADSDQLQATEIWDLTAPKHLWFTSRFKASEALDSAVLVGLCITDTTLLGGMTDGLYFRKSDADNTLQAVAEKDSTESTVDIVEMVDDTYVEVGLYYKAGDAAVVEVYLRNVATEGTGISKEFADNSKARWSKVGQLTSNLPDDEALAVSMAILNGNAVANTLTIDYIQVAQERN